MAAPKTPMSNEHKKALAQGRREAAVVRDYLDYLATDKRRGPKRTPQQLQTKLKNLVDEIEQAASPTAKLELIQERIDTEDALDELKSAQAVDAQELEAAFVKVASGYAKRKGISYAAWREFGVPADALKAAGIKRTRRG